MNTKEILECARAKIAKGWTRNVYARLPNGRGTRYNDPEAVEFCMMGAIFSCTPEGESWSGAVQALAVNLPHDVSIPEFNDSCDSVERVLATFDKALAQ